MVGTIKKLCKEKKMSLCELARRTGMKHNLIDRWDRHEPSVYKVAAVAQELGVTVEELIAER